MFLLNCQMIQISISKLNLFIYFITRPTPNARKFYYCFNKILYIKRIRKHIFFQRVLELKPGNFLT